MALETDQGVRQIYFQSLDDAEKMIAWISGEHPITIGHRRLGFIGRGTLQPLPNAAVLSASSATGTISRSPIDLASCGTTAAAQDPRAVRTATPVP